MVDFLKETLLDACGVLLGLIVGVLLVLGVDALKRWFFRE